MSAKNYYKKAVLSQRWPRNALYTGALKIFSSCALALLTLTVTVYLSWIWTRHAYKCKVHNKASRRGAIVGTGPLVRRSTTPIFPFHCFKFTMLNLKNNRYIVMKSTKFIKMNLLNSSFSELFFTRACWRHSLRVLRELRRKAWLIILLLSYGNEWTVVYPIRSE